MLGPLRSVRVAEWLSLPTSGHEVLGSNPAGDEIQLMIARRFIARGLFIITLWSSRYFLNDFS